MTAKDDPGVTDTGQPAAVEGESDSEIPPLPEVTPIPPTYGERGKNYHFEYPGEGLPRRRTELGRRLAHLLLGD